MVEKTYINKLVFTDYIADYILWAKLRYVYKNKRCWNQVQFAFAVPVSGLIPDLKRSDGSFPQASCNWV